MGGLLTNKVDHAQGAVYALPDLSFKPHTLILRPRGLLYPISAQVVVRFHILC